MGFVIYCIRDSYKDESVQLFRYGVLPLRKGVLSFHIG